MVSGSAKSFIKSLGRQAMARSENCARESPKAFFRRHHLFVRQPVPLPFHHFVLQRLAETGLVVQQLSREFDPYWAVRIRADQGAARRGIGAVRRGILSAFHALGSTHPVTDLLVERRRNLFDVCFLCHYGSKGGGGCAGADSSTRLANETIVPMRPANTERKHDAHLGRGVSEATVP